jgi:hypothetical protein
MAKWLTVGGGLLGVCLVLSGCGKAVGGGTDAGGLDSDAAPVALEAFASSYAQGLCRNMAGCCERQQFEFDADNCEKVTTKVMQSFIDSQLTAHTIYDPQEAGACLQVVQANATCGDPELVLKTGPCARFLVGTLENSESCKSDSECRSGTCYLRGDESRSGSCAEPYGPTPFGKKGDDCSSTCEDAPSCPDGGGVPAAINAPARETSVACLRSQGLHCVGTCQPLAGEGEQCAIVEDCKPGLACAGGVCGPRFDTGAACRSDLECTSGFCQKGQCTSGVSAQQCNTDGPF